jgi:hypothetical protein
LFSQEDKVAMVSSVGFSGRRSVKEQSRRGDSSSADRSYGSVTHVVAGWCSVSRDAEELGDLGVSKMDSVSDLGMGGCFDPLFARN